MHIDYRTRRNRSSMLKSVVPNADPCPHKVPGIAFTQGGYLATMRTSNLFSRRFRRAAVSNRIGCLKAPSLLPSRVTITYLRPRNATVACEKFSRLRIRSWPKLAKLICGEAIISSALSRVRLMR